MAQMSSVPLGASLSQTNHGGASAFLHRASGVEGDAFAENPNAARWAFVEDRVGAVRAFQKREPKQKRELAPGVAYTGVEIVEPLDGRLEAAVRIVHP